MMSETVKVDFRGALGRFALDAARQHLHHLPVRAAEDQGLERVEALAAMVDRVGGRGGGPAREVVAGAGVQRPADRVPRILDAP